MVLGLCRLLLRDHHEAEDAAQQTFVSAYRSLLRGTEPRDPAPWLAAIARNECRARIRRRMRAPFTLDHELEEQIADPTDLVDETERRAELAALTAAIAELPSRQREAVALRDFLGLSYEEVASTLSVSVPVVESLLFRARRRLRDTVRTVPRYAAGIVAIPLAIRAAVSRDLPDLDSTGTLGAAGIACAAVTGVIAKVISLQFAGKAATAVTMVAVATAGPQVPGLFDGDGAGGGDGAQPSAIAAPEDSPSWGAPAIAESPSKPPASALDAHPADAPPDAASSESPAPVESSTPPDETEQPAPLEEQPAEDVDPTREVVTTDAGVGPAHAPPSGPPQASPPSRSDPAPGATTEPATTAPESTTTPAAEPPVLGETCPADAGADPQGAGETSPPQNEPGGLHSRCEESPSAAAPPSDPAPADSPPPAETEQPAPEQPVEAPPVAPTEPEAAPTEPAADESATP